jgi:hypothetical protein
MPQVYRTPEDTLRKVHQANKPIALRAALWFVCCWCVGVVAIYLDLKVIVFLATLGGFWFWFKGVRAVWRVMTMKLPPEDSDM